MLISALYEYHDVLSKDGKLVKPGYTNQPVGYKILLRQDGSIADIVKNVTLKDIGKDKKGKPVVKEIPKTALLPKRTEKSGIDANLIEHRPRYIFGLEYVKGVFEESSTAAESRLVFAERNLEFIEKIDSAIVNAYRSFIQNWVPADHVNDKLLLDLGKAVASSYYCFALDGRPDMLLHEDEQLIIRYEQLLSEKTDEDLQTGSCAVTGKTDQPIPLIHGVIKGVIGGQPSGTKLVCFNNDSELSYGKKQAVNSNISADVARAYTEALNYLLSSENHHINIDGMTLIYWSMTPRTDNDDGLCDIFTSFLSSYEDKAGEDEVNKRLKDLMHKSRVGKVSDADLDKSDIDPNTTFYIAGIMPNASRLSVKFILRDTVMGIFDNIAHHQADLSHDGLKFQPSVKTILKEMYSPVVKDKKIPSPLYAAMFESILKGVRYPTALLSEIVRRCKTDSDKKDEKTNKIVFYGINTVRVAIIKACLNRQSRFNNSKEEIKMSLDKENSSPAYVCGRIFALLEIAQRCASGVELNRTVKDSYFSSACSKPGTVLPKLMMLAQHHLSKADNGTWINRQIGEAVDLLEGGFPSTLDLEEQGQFIVGYYQQNKDFYTPSNEKKS